MKTVVIIGAGFSGAVTAAQLLRQSPSGVRVVLVNRSGAMARGLAYGTNSPLHLLNVPAGNMSAYVDEPEHFLQFCQTQNAAYTASSFVPRKIYGDYLASVLDEAEQRASDDVKLERVVSEVDCLRPSGEGAILELRNGRKINADQVVLAFGNFSPLDPPGFNVELGAHCYQSDPWLIEAPLPDQDSSILLVGAGLTALDVSLGLLQQGHRGPIYMVSRRGLSPLPHRPHRPTPYAVMAIAEKLLQSPPSVRVYMRLIRQEVSNGHPHGVDWRDFLAAIRSITPVLWERLPDAQRRRFLRHAQPYWDVHRHRVAPAANERFEQALSTGQIHMLSGRIKSVSQTHDGLRIDIHLRGGEKVKRLSVSRVINCTGPNTDLNRVTDGLITQLKEDGLVQRDMLGLGLNVDDQLAVRNAQGYALPWLHYVGPMLKAGLWEATAVPELRQHAKALALNLIEKIN